MGLSQINDIDLMNEKKSLNKCKRQILRLG